MRILFYIFFYENCAICEIMWKKVTRRRKHAVFVPDN
jgi:hypothetical protein